MIYLTGDTHGEVDIFKLSNKRFKEAKSLTKKDYLIVMGDFGVIFWPEKYSHKTVKNEEYLIKFLNERNFTTLFIHGNHDNVPRLETYPTIKMFDSEVKQISDSIFYLLDSHIYNIDGNSIFCLGGATSIDKIYRKNEITWWKEEVPAYMTIKQGFEILEKHNNKVDYVFSHAVYRDAVLELFNGYEKFDDIMSENLQMIHDTIDFKKWYCGHYHKEEDLKNLKTRALYNNIVELGK